MTDAPSNSPAQQPDPASGTTLTLINGQPAPTGQSPQDDTPPVENPEGTPPPETPAFTWEQVTLPDGVQVDDALKDQFVTLMNDKELTPEKRAQGLVDLQVTAAQNMSKAIETQWNTMKEAWVTEVKNDPMIGGDKLPGNLTKIGQLIDEFGSPELRQAFDLTGAGDNPHVVRFLAKVAEQLTEAKAATGGGQGETVKSLANRLFPSMTS